MEIDYALVDEDGKALTQRRRRWPQLVKWALLVLLAIVLIFHRPIVFGVGRSVANHYAAKANFRIDRLHNGRANRHHAKISHNEAGENCASEGAIDSKVCLGRVAIRHGTPNAKNDRPVKYQDDSE